MIDIWHPEPLPGAVTVDLTAPGSIELVMELRDNDGKPEAIIRLDPFSGPPAVKVRKPRRVYRKPDHIYFTFPIFRITKRSRKHGTTKR